MTKKDKNVEPAPQQGPSTSLFNVVITVQKDGNIKYQIVADKDEDIPDQFSVVGLLEMVKSTILSSNAPQQPQMPSPEMVEITIVEEDFSLPTGKNLKQLGKQAGDKVMVPKFIAEQRAAILKEIKENPDKVKEMEAATKVVPMAGPADA